MITVYAFNGRTLFNARFTLFSRVLMALKGFIYTVVADIYA